MPALSPMYQLASDIVDGFAALDPVTATRSGIPGHDDEMTDYSPAGRERLNAFWVESLRSVAATSIIDERDRVCRDVMTDGIGLRIAQFEAGEHLRQLSIIGSPAQAVRGVFDVMPRATAADWETIAKRLARVPEAVTAFEAVLADGLRRGITAARRQVEANIRQAETWSGAGAATPFFDTLLTAYDASGVSNAAVRTDLSRAATAANEAYGGLATYLRERYYDGAIERDGVGRERYALSSRAFNGIDLDLDETYAWGWDELYRVEAEMRTTAARILPGATVPDTIAFLEQDPARSIEGVEAFRQWMQDLQDRTIAELQGVHFDIPEALKAIEAMIAPPGGALAMYYTGPSEDFTRPGRTWYPTGGKTRFPLWGEVSIAYHEGVPGHHFQIATRKYLVAQLSRYQRLLAGPSGYVEGWALYAERLMGELGYLDNPDYYLGMLRAQAMRSVRVVVDIGMHLELPIPASERFHPGETWTAELGDTFARERACFPADFMASEVTRYLGTPGQAISYKVGERCWLEAQADSRARRGEAFDLKAWHKRALELGPMGLEQMRREMAGL